MREFVYGTDEQYNMLKNTLGDGMCHVYQNCVMPPCCNSPTARIGFEKEGETYAIFIDKGMTCSPAAPGLFKEWIREGTLRFMDYTDMKSFLRSLTSLF